MQLLGEKNLRAPNESKGSLSVALTDPPDRFLDVAREALQLEIGEVELRQVIHSAKS